MEVEVTARSEGIPDQAKTYAAERLGRVRRIFDRIGRIHVSLERSKDNSLAHAVLHMDTGATVSGDARHAELRHAIDDLADKLERQVRKEKGRLIERNRRAPQVDAVPTEPPEPSYDDVIRDSLDED